MARRLRELLLATSSLMAIPSAVMAGGPLASVPTRMAAPPSQTMMLSQPFHHPGFMITTPGVITVNCFGFSGVPGTTFFMPGQQFAAQTWWSTVEEPVTSPSPSPLASRSTRSRRN